MEKITFTKEHTYSGSLILVTPEFSLGRIRDRLSLQSIFPNPEMKAPFLPRVSSQPDILLEKQAAEALQGLLADIGCKDEIVAVSGFRTQGEQEKIWEESMAQNGEIFTRKFVAVPGHSEHQSGYAIDLAENSPKIDFICPRFPYRGIFQRFRERMADFGFVERYAALKEGITGIGAEPWHFRYVGYPHSVIMTHEGMALEEYIGFLKNDTGWGRPYIFREAGNWVEITYLSLENNRTRILDVPEGASCQASGTNEGGVVLSLWRETA